MKRFLQRLTICIDVYFTLKKSTSMFIVIEKRKNGECLITERAEMHTFKGDLNK